MEKNFFKRWKKFFWLTSATWVSFAMILNFGFFKQKCMFYQHISLCNDS